MKFQPTPLQGSYVIGLEERSDERGFFARSFCKREFAALKLETEYPQMNNSLSLRRGTLRGLHYQVAPASEVKVVRCIQGAVHDVIVDLRADSATFGRHYGIELSAENRQALYVPRGFAHGFLTLTENAEMFYMVSAEYSPAHERGIRYDDPRFSIAWPFAPAVVSDRDAAHPNYDPELQPATWT